MPRSRHRRKPARRKHLARGFAGADPACSVVEDQKMSEVLLAFIAPYRHLARDDAALERLIALGVVAWNVALLPASKRDSTLNQFVTELFGGKRSSLMRRFGSVISKWMREGWGAGADTESAEETDCKETVRELIERKLQRFSHNRRAIVSYQVHLTDDDVQLVVVSTLQQTRVQ